MRRPLLFYSGDFVLPLPEGHRFPMTKYAMLRDAMIAAGHGRLLAVPPAATDTELRRAHDAAWVQAVTTGQLDRAAERRIGFPWSPGMVERSRRSVGGTLAAARAALDGGVGINLAGGTHHALRDVAEGYCVFNDVAVAVRVLQAEQAIRRVIVIDTDVHQGNGTAAIFAGDDTVVTVDLYGARNFPFTKVAATVDVPLADGTTDAEYLSRLEEALRAGCARGPFDLAFFVAGADAWEGDALGRLRVTRQGLAHRDAQVLGMLRERRIPAVVVMGGGYAPDIRDTVDIHRATIQEALKTALAAASAVSSPTSTTVSPAAKRKAGSGA